MNIEKFTDALGEVDDKYVTEALSYKKSKRGRKYIFTFAAAACILLVVAAGDRFLTGPAPDENADRHLSKAEASESGESSGNGGPGIGLWMYDFDEYEMASPWTEDMNFENLPVYKNLSYHKAGAPIGLSEEEMEKRFMAAAKALGLDFQSREAVTETYPDYLNDMKETEWVTKITGTTEDTTLTVYANGETEVKFEPAIKLPGNYNFTYGNTSDGEAREVLDYLCGEYSDLIGFDEARKITWNSYGISSDLDDDDEITNSYPVVDRQYQVTDISGEGAERLLNTNFRKATFAPYDDNSLWIIRVYDVYDSLEKLGDYPLISIDEAREKLQKGESAMIGTDEKYPVEDMSKVVGIELSYKYSVLDEYTLPYYVFWVETGEIQFGLKQYSPIYVPAIEEEYLSDIPTYDGSFNG